MFLAFALAAALPQTPAAQTVLLVDNAFRGKPTELVVLGTVHLSELDHRFTPARLAPLIGRLERWKPNVITVEALTGRDCDDTQARPDLFGAELPSYCQVALAARTSLGVNQSQAEKAIDEALRATAERTPEQRRHLAALFLAAGDPGSALVQWLRLPVGERRADARLGPELVAAMGRYAASRNETYALGSVLAARLGLERIHPTDDQSGGRHVAALDEGYAKRITTIWDNPAVKSAAAERERETDAFLKGGDVLAWYRWENAPAKLAGQMRGDFAAAIADTSPEQSGRLYIGYWEARNLNMVANMRFAFGDRPGARVLSIVGSSHKPYFERYFGTQSDVRIVPVENLLR